MQPDIMFTAGVLPKRINSARDCEFTSSLNERTFRLLIAPDPYVAWGDSVRRAVYSTVCCIRLWRNKHRNLRMVKRRGAPRKSYVSSVPLIYRRSTII